MGLRWEARPLVTCTKDVQYSTSGGYHRRRAACPARALGLDPAPLRPCSCVCANLPRTGPEQRGALVAGLLELKLRGSCRGALPVALPLALALLLLLLVLLAGVRHLDLRRRLHGLRGRCSS